MLRRNIWLVAILFIAGILLFTNLGNQYLWMDEAETAILARSILKTGLPYAWDGKNLMMVGGNGSEFNQRLLWTLHPWLQHYITSLSFLAFGENTRSARLPFALLAWFTIYFLYLLTYNITSNKKIAILAAFLLTASIPFILYMRQCRYYALLACFSFPLTYFYYKMPQKKYTFLFSLFSMLLFFSHYLFFATIWLGLAIYFFAFDFSVKKFKYLLCSALPVSFLAIIWVFPMGLKHTINAWLFSGGRKLLSSSLIEIVRRELSFLINLNMTIIPLSLLVLAFLIFLLKRRRMGSPRLYTLLLFVISVNIVLIPLTGIHPERYSMGFIPLFFVLMAMMFYEIFASQKILGILAILVFLSTNIFNEFPAFFGKPLLSLMPVTRDKLSNALGEGMINPLGKDIKEALMGKKYYLNFLYEITHDYDGPAEGIVEFLNHNAESGDTVLTPYCQNFILFYCGDKDLRLAKVVEDKEGFLKGHPELRTKLPDYIFDYADLDWFIPRSGWPGIGYTEEDILRHVEKRGWKWKCMEIPYPDIKWNNRPELRLHYFRTARDAKKIVIYKIYKGEKSS